MLKTLIKCGAAATLALMAFAWPAPEKINVWMIGDSTMCVYPKEQRPVTGWGMPFADYFDAAVNIKNKAKGGRSTKTFLSENMWAPIADSLQEGDYVLIQFGHNDEGKGPKYAARAASVEDYSKNLVKFITETRAKKANPVLITPVTRRYFDKDNKIQETHLEYSNAVRAIGKEYKVPVIDLDERSRELMQNLGPEQSAMLYIGLDSAEHPNYPNGHGDKTHFNEYGARRVAELVLNDLKSQHVPLADHIVKLKPAAK